ncbi:MAG: FtsX-like permease family protein [Pseudomonadota bacterium]
MNLSTLLAFNLRYYRHNLHLAFLCLAGIALGVGIIVAVELISNSALSSFSESIDFLSGQATHTVESGYGRIEERRFADIWKHPAVKAASPVVDVQAATVQTGGEPIRFIGLDPFLSGEFRAVTPIEGDEKALHGFLTSRVPSVYLSLGTMLRHGIKPGDTLSVLKAGIEKPVVVLGALPGSDSMDTGENTALMDIAGAQELFGKTGYLDRIDIIATGDIESLINELPPGLAVTDRSERKSTFKAMLYSFQLNLGAMSLLALFVGIFLIYNFSMFSVLSRREDMSLLLTMGADHRALVGAFLVEALIFGAVGGLLGTLLGYATAWAGIGRVSSTISDLYSQVHASRVELTLPILLTGMGVGFTAVALGTALPAMETAMTRPILGMKRQSIEDRTHHLKGRLFIAGWVCFAASGIAVWASRYSIFWGFAAAFAMTVAFALFTPSIVSFSTHYLGLALRKLFDAPASYLAARTIRASLSRAGMAVAALAVALAMTIGVDNMIYSFRESVNSWLEGALQGDLYISPATTRWGHPLPDELITMMKSDPRIAAVERYSTYDMRFEGKPIKLRVVDADILKDRSKFHFLKAGPTPWDDIIQGGLFISESLSYRFGLDVGDRLRLFTPDGERAFSVAAVVRDYSSDQGAAQIHREVYERFWKDTRVQSVAAFLRPGESAEDVRTSIVKAFPGLERTVVSNARMRENVFVIFDKTFAPTSTLKGVSLMVALLGVATALMAILIERTREMTVLSYLGLTVGELGAINVYQALIMGLLAFVVAVFCGTILTYIIIYAINYRSFGWSIDVLMNPGVFAKSFGLTVAASLASSLYPTYRLVKSRIGRSMQEE